MKFKHTRKIAVSLGAELAAHRELRGETQEHVARRAGIARTSLVKIERGEHCPTVDTLVAIACVLNVHPDLILRHAVETLDTDPRAKVIPWLFRGSAKR